jgi:hypothetical protein
MGNHDGTFRRSVAQQAPRLHFFNVGDPLFNAIIRSLDRHATGRTFAIELLVPDRPIWIGLECQFIASLDGNGLGNAAGLRNRADAIFVPRPLSVMIDLDAHLSSEVETMIALRRRLDHGQHGQTWWDLSGADDTLASALSVDTWPDAVAQLIERAESDATRQFATALAAPIAAERARVESIIRGIQEAAPSDDVDAAALADTLERYVSALPQWTMHLDAVGLISINGKLRLGQLQ